MSTVRETTHHLPWTGPPTHPLDQIWEDTTVDHTPMDRTTLEVDHSGDRSMPTPMDHARQDADRTNTETLRQQVQRTMVLPRRLLRSFYFAVLAVALIGQTTSAAHWLHWYLIFAGAAVLTLELGGVAVLSYADARRQLGERAITARLLSLGIAGFAVTVNWAGHLGPKGQVTMQAGFFAGMSALGYLVWLIDTEAKRRDRLRITNRLAAAPPVYELWGHWLRHPMITGRAKSLAKANPALGTYDSWRQASRELQRDKRNRGLTEHLRTLIARSAGARMADIATCTYDLDRIAEWLRKHADYDRLSEILAADLAPDRIVADQVDRTTRRPKKTTPVLVQTSPPRSIADHPAALVQETTLDHTPPADRPGGVDRTTTEETTVVRLDQNIPVQPGSAVDQMASAIDAHYRTNEGGPLDLPSRRNLKEEMERTAQHLRWSSVGQVQRAINEVKRRRCDNNQERSA